MTLRSLAPAFTKGLQIFVTSLFPLLLMPTLCQAGNYNQKKSMHDTLLDSKRYNPMQRPLLDQSRVLRVNFGFELVSIVEINDVIQSFKCNGFFGFSWYDELLQWNSSDYGGESILTPRVTSIFRPQLVLLNTLEDRDVFEDDHAPLTVHSDGNVQWVPGSIFSASCQLNLTKFPLDEQHCMLQLVAMNFNASEIIFVPEVPFIMKTFFTPNGLWDITNHAVAAPNITVRSDVITSIVVHFRLKRKPQFLALSTLLPVTFLSLLNLLVFVIPVESGEKISYGITVLLALALFLSITSGMLPPSSESMPLIIYYIFNLLAISVLSVVVSVIIVWLYHKEDKENIAQRSESNFQALMPRIRISNPTVTSLQNPGNGLDPKTDKPRKEKSYGVDIINDPKKPKTMFFSEPNALVAVNKYRQLGKHLDTWSLVLFGIVWVSITMGFTIAVFA